MNNRLRGSALLSQIIPRDIQNTCHKFISIKARVALNLTAIKWRLSVMHSFCYLENDSPL